MYFVYILTSKKNGTLYIGVTSNLVYFESYEDVNEALLREKRLKKWNRLWKIELIKKNNPNWKDLYSEIT